MNILDISLKSTISSNPPPTALHGGNHGSKITDMAILFTSNCFKTSKPTLRRPKFGVQQNCSTSKMAKHLFTTNPNLWLDFFFFFSSSLKNYRRYKTLFTS